MSEGRDGRKGMDGRHTAGNGDAPPQGLDEKWEIGVHHTVRRVTHSRDSVDLSRQASFEGPSGTA